MNSIIIDHHKVDNDLPVSYAHINPSREEDSSGLNDLAAVGLTFIFIVGLRRAIRDKNIFPDIKEPSLKQYLDLVALGTVCDVVQLKGLNRGFVKEGIEIISRHSRLGIEALKSISGSKENRKAGVLSWFFPKTIIKLNSAVKTKQNCSFVIGSLVDKGNIGIAAGKELIWSAGGNKGKICHLNMDNHSKDSDILLVNTEV